MLARNGGGGGGVVHTPPPPSPPTIPTPYPSRPPPPPSLPTQGFLPGVWVPLMVGGQQARTPLSTGLAALGLSGSALHAFASALQGVVAAGVSAAVPSPAPSAPTGKVVTPYILNLWFACGVVVDGKRLPIWEAVAWGKGRMRFFGETFLYTQKAKINIFFYVRDFFKAPILRDLLSNKHRILHCW